jgi:transposase
MRMPPRGQCYPPEPPPSPKPATGTWKWCACSRWPRISATKSRAQAINQLKAILVRADPDLCESLSGLSNHQLVRRCADLDPTTPTTTSTAAACALRSLAQRILRLTEEIDELSTQITGAINAAHPTLLDRYGVGPDTAAALLIAAGDNPVPEPTLHLPR